MKEINITAKHKKWSPDWEDDISNKGVYKVRELNESNSGIKRIWLWGFKDYCSIDDVDLMINGEAVKWK